MVQSRKKFATRRFARSLIAIAPRHGLDFLPIKMFAGEALDSEVTRQEMQTKVDSVWGAGRFAGRTLKLPPVDRLVHGKLIDLEGNPHANVKVVIETVFQSGHGSAGSGIRRGLGSTGESSEKRKVLAMGHNSERTSTAVNTTVRHRS